MSKLRDAQSDHQQRIAVLTDSARLMGLRLRAGDGYRNTCQNRCVNGHPNSLHMDRLAHDFALDYWNGSRWVASWANVHFNRLHDVWDLIGGTARIDSDLGHFSTAHPNKPGVR